MALLYLKNNRVALGIAALMPKIWQVTASCSFDIDVTIITGHDRTVAAHEKTKTDDDVYS